MACPVLFRRYLILLKSPGRVWEAHNGNFQTAEENAAGTTQEHPIQDKTKSVSWSAGAVLALLNAGFYEGILKALYVALYRTFAPKGMNVEKLYQQLLTCVLQKCVRGQADRHLESFCENYVTPTRMSSQLASDLYALGKHIDELR